MDRSFNPSPEHRHLKRLSGQLIALVHGVEAAASYCRIGKSQLSDACNAQVPAFLPLDVLADLEAVAGAPIITRRLANLLGFALVQLPDGRDACAGDVHCELGAVSRKTGEVVQRVCQALADGKITAAEARALGIRAAIAQAQECLARLDTIVAQIEAEG